MIVKIAIIERHIRKATRRVNQMISGQVDQSNKFSRGLSGEGWLGGYRAALQDVQHLLSDCIPPATGADSRREEIWEHMDKLRSNV